MTTRTPSAMMSDQMAARPLADSRANGRYFVLRIRDRERRRSATGVGEHITLRSCLSSHLNGSLSPRHSFWQNKLNASR